MMGPPVFFRERTSVSRRAAFAVPLIPAHTMVLPSLSLSLSLSLSVSLSLPLPLSLSLPSPLLPRVIRTPRNDDRGWPGLRCSSRPVIS